MQQYKEEQIKPRFMSKSFSRKFELASNLENEAARVILDRISGQCKKERIRLDQFFKVYDNLKNKKVTSAQFQRGLSASGVKAPSQTELEWLLQRYSVDGAPDLVNYQRFVDEMEQLAVLSKTGQTQQKLKGAYNHGFGGWNQKLSNQERVLFQDALDTLLQISKQSGLCLRVTFEQFDPHCHGRVNSEIFINQLCILAKLHLPSHRTQLNALVNAYKADGNEVSYARLEDDLHTAVASGRWPWDVGGENEQSALRKGKSAYKAEENWEDRISTNNLATLERLLQLQAQKRRIVVEEIFAPCDRLSKGLCTFSEFQKGLTQSFTAPFTLSQLEALTEKYEEKGMVNYRRFAASLRRPTSAPVHASRRSLADFKSSHDEEINLESEADRVMTQLRATVIKSHLFLKRSFEDFDRWREGCVTGLQFLRVLSNTGIINLAGNSPAALALFKRYEVKDLSHPSGVFVDYIHFLTDMTTGSKQPEEVSMQELETNGERETQQWSGDMLNQPKRSSSPDITKPSTTIFDLVEGIREYVQVNHIRPKEFFSDFDPLRHGSISPTLFARGLAQMGLTMNVEDLQSLCTHYQDTLRRDTKRRCFVHYSAFIRDVLRSHQTTNLFSNNNRETAQSCPFLQPVSSTGTFQFVSTPTLSPEEDEELADVLSKIAVKVSKERIDLLQSFQGFDPPRRGYIAQASFERGLTLSGIIFVEKRPFHLLSKRFREPSKSSYKDVNYRAFLKALDEIIEGNTPREVISVAEFKRAVNKLNKRTGTNSGVRTSTPFQDSVTERGWKKLSDSWPVASKVNTQRPTTSKQVLVETLRDIRRHIEQRRVDFRDFFVDADKTKRGLVPANKFFVALDQAGLVLSPSQLQALETEYELPSNLNDMIDCRTFLNAVYSIPASEGEVSEADPITVEQVLSKVRTHFQKKRISLKQDFEVLDRFKTHQIPKEKLCWVLQKVNLMLSKQEEECLSKAFRVGKGHYDPNSINYEAFLEAVESEDS